MRVIGRIEPKFDKDNNCENAPYIDGAIVELTSKEAATIKALQEACAGNNWPIEKLMHFYRSKPDDIDMDDLFGLVWTYTQSRFAVNDFKTVVNQLEETLNRLDKIPNEL